ncbi:MAG: DUF58 domain-containing protein [Planctomycetes bacterium]|nr:DUF58 domain-containing protein [Planctomycetota bacterium]
MNGPAALLRRYHLHAPGFVYGAMTILVGLAAVNRQNNLLFWILGMMLSALLMSGLVSGIMMQSLRVRRLVAGHGLVGEPLRVRYWVTNRSRFLPAFALHIEELPVDGPGGWTRLMRPARAWVMHLGPRETVHGEAVFWPTQRGEVRFDRVRIWTTFPFGIIRKSKTISQPQHTLIHPLLYEVRREILRSVAPQGLAGSRVSRRTGTGDDYYGMRDFRPGDTMRHIAWKRSACLDELVCLERTMPTPPRLRVIVNLTTPTHRLRVDARRETYSPRQLEERAISLAASIIHAADLAGFEIGLSLPGTDRPAILTRRGHWHRARVMSSMAAIDLDAPRTGSGPLPTSYGERAAQIVIHPDRVDPSIGREDALHLSARHMSRLTVRSIGWDPGTAPPESPESPKFPESTKSTKSRETRDAAPAETAA